jgi:rare lipoprotein A
MHGLTCAHRELPFGTVLQVTNIKNDKTVRCVVNDRGPFVAGRDLDLSYGAAKEIGLKSTGPVRIVLLGREAGYAKEVKYVSSGGPYTVQVGAFTEMDSAARLKSALELKYNDVYIIEATVNEVTFYRVRIGKFQSKKEAFSLAKTLAGEGYSPVIMHYDERA